VAADGFSSDLARELAPAALERFLRYVRVDTAADPHSETSPSSAKQLDLSRLLRDELAAIGAADVELTEHGYVFATLPATTSAEAATIGLVAHVDTSPAESGTGVDPQVVRGYDGGDIVLSGDPREVLSPEAVPELRNHVGHDLVTSDGTTLLGADDKAGVAEIVTAAAFLLEHPEIPHGRVRIAFTTDEEIGAGTEHFDLERFGAEAAYTLDGSTLGELQDETFSASAVRVTIHGHSTHPGTAKGILVNSVKLAARFLEKLPRDGLSPETTEEREGYVHPDSISGSVARTTIELIARDHDGAKLVEHENLLHRLAAELADEEPRCRVEVEIKQSYRNMKDYLGEDSPVVARAEEAIRRAGIEPVRTLVRGGTDGSRLTEMGLPTPNIFTGGHDYHSKREWACVQDMGAACATIVHLVQVWAEA
jgi:tripeptide aminopeptidase